MKSSLPPPPPLDVEHANRWSNLKPPSPLTLDLDLDLNLKMPSNDVAEENGHCWLFDALRLGDDLCATAQKGAGEDERDEDREKRTARWRWGRWKRQRKFRYVGSGNGMNSKPPIPLLFLISRSVLNISSLQFQVSVSPHLLLVGFGGPPEEDLWLWLSPPQQPHQVVALMGWVVVQYENRS
nr:ankyrin repeat RF-like protein, putative [Ipomoea batatas]